MGVGRKLRWQGATTAADPISRCGQDGRDRYTGTLPTLLRRLAHLRRVVDHTSGAAPQIDADTVVDGNVTYYASGRPGELR
jgi:hypothetical protein